MRKYLKALLVICLVLSFVCQIKPSAAVSYDDSFNVSGYTMSEDYFKAAYGSNPADRKEILATRDGETKASANVRISNIEVKDNVISLSLNMGTGGKNIMIGGEMYASARTQYGVNNIVVHAKCSDVDYDILLFEIWNDTDTDRQILYNTALNGTPHMKLYLQEASGKIHIFELNLPQELRGLNASSYTKADSSIDLLWPLKVVDATVTEIPTSNAILEELNLNDPLRDPNTWLTWLNSRVYTHTFYISDEQYTSTSLPYVDYRYTNVTAQDSTWSAVFKVAEHLRVTGPGGFDESYFGNNAIQYRNVSLAFGCGDNTTIMRTFQEGRVTDMTTNSLKTEGNVIFINALKHVVSQYPVAVGYFDIVDHLSAMLSSSKSVQLGSIGVNLSTEKVIAAGEKLQDRYRIMACTDQNGTSGVGEYFAIQTVSQYENAGGNTNTIGVLKVDFEVHMNQEGYPKSRSAKIEFNYTVSAS